MKRSNRKSQWIRGVLVMLAAVALARAGRLNADEKAGWFLAGSKPNDYTMTFEKSRAHTGSACGALHAKATAGEGFGTMMQMFQADAYRDKRVRLTAWARSENVADWAGVWMRVDGSKNESLAFDNMQDRPIKGTTGWTKYDIVLDVAPDATNMAFGILLSGRGNVWIDDVGLTVVDKGVPTTGKAMGQAYPKAPTHLNFEN